MLNLGVLGYSSYNGLELWRTKAATLAADVVLIAFAANEPRDVGAEGQIRRPSTAAARLLDRVESYPLTNRFRFGRSSLPRM